MSILTDSAMKVRLQLELIVHRDLRFSRKTKLWQDIALKEPQENSLQTWARNSLSIVS